MYKCDLHPFRSDGIHDTLREEKKQEEGWRMARRSPEERLAALNQKLAQLESRKHALETQTQEKERKARTRMLIQMGGIMVKLGMDSLDKVQALQRQVEVHPDWWARLTQSAPEPENAREPQENPAPAPPLQRETQDKGTVPPPAAGPRGTA